MDGSGALYPGSGRGGPLRRLQRTSLRGRAFGGGDGCAFGAGCLMAALVGVLGRSTTPLCGARWTPGAAPAQHSLGPFLFSSSSTLLICKVLQCRRGGGAEVVSTPSWHRGGATSCVGHPLGEELWVAASEALRVSWRGPDRARVASGGCSGETYTDALVNVHDDDAFRHRLPR